MFRGFEGHLTASTIQFEKEKKQNTKTAAVSHNTLYRTWASLHHQTAFDQKKKKKTKGVIRFTFLDSLLYLWNDQFGARRTEPETYFFAQPSWSNMIFLQHLTLTWQSLSVCVEKCESCSCENTWEVMCVRCYDSPSWNLCKIFFVDFTLKVKMLKPQNVSNLCKKKIKICWVQSWPIEDTDGGKTFRICLIVNSTF